MPRSSLPVLEGFTATRSSATGPAPSSTYGLCGLRSKFILSHRWNWKVQGLSSRPKIPLLLGRSQSLLRTPGLLFCRKLNITPYSVVLYPCKYRLVGGDTASISGERLPLEIDVGLTVVLWVTPERAKKLEICREDSFPPRQLRPELRNRPG